MFFLIIIIPVAAVFAALQVFLCKKYERKSIRLVPLFITLSIIAALGVLYIDPVSALIFSALFLHESMTSVQIIGARAFRNCSSMLGITIPASVTCIGEDAFSGCTNVVITCFEGSAAHAYALSNNIPFNLM